MHPLILMFLKNNLQSRGYEIIDPGRAHCMVP